MQRNETYLPKFDIKTNALYWVTTTPNLGLEIGLAKKMTLDISGNYNPWKFGDDRQLKHWLVQPELRYWLCERFKGPLAFNEQLSKKYAEALKNYLVKNEKVSSKLYSVTFGGEN